MKTVAIVGMGLSPDDLPAGHLALIHKADILIGGRRHLAAFPGFKGQTRNITGDLPSLSAYIKARMSTRRIVVLASGDPLFYGIGDYLSRTLGRENVTTLPNISAVAGAFARIRIPWHDACVVSLHGRRRMDLVADALASHEKVAVFTDPEQTPGRLAAYLAEKGITDVDMWVAEQMGDIRERVARLDLTTAAQRSFREPNMVVLIRRPGTANERPALRLGMPDEYLAHQRGMITKPEVRVISLSKLRLQPDHVFWDLGAGSGSVACEASLFVKTGRIIAVEKNADRIRHITANKARFHVDVMEVVHGKMPDILPQLPRPHRVFIGGGGKDLGRIVDTAAGRMHPGGIIVINTVVLASLQAAVEALENNGFNTETVQVQINVGKRMPPGERMEARNPVWVVTGSMDGCGP